MKILAPFFFLLILNSCELTIPVVLPEQEPKLVVNSLFYIDEVFEIEVTSSKPMIDNTNSGYLPISNAIVKLFEDGAEIEQLPYDILTERYLSNLKPIEGKSYKVEVSHADYPMVNAEDYVPLAVSLSDFIFEKNIRQKDGEWESDFSFIVNDHEVQNYYSIEIYLMDTINMDINPICFSTLDASINAGESFFGNENEFCNRVYFDDKLFNNTNHKMVFSIKQFYLDWGHQLYIVFRSLSKANYLYNISKELQSYTQDNPFAEPVLVFNNIKEGLGIFAGGSYRTFEVVF